MGDGVMHQPARNVHFLHRSPSPCNHLGGEYRLDACLLTDREKKGVKAGGVRAGELSNIADSHQLGSGGVATMYLRVALERRSEAKAHRFDDRIDEVLDTPALQRLDA